MPPFQAPDPVSTGVFVAIVMVVAACTVVGLAEGSRLGGADARRVGQNRVTATLLVSGWLAITAVLPASGLIGLAPATMMLFFLGSNALALVLALSPAGRLLAHLPLVVLVGFHAFRLPLELVLHTWASQGTIPVDMTWTGRNFDIVTGVAAIVGAGWLYARPQDRFVGTAFTALGLALLLNVARVALSCAPVALPLHVQCEPPLLLALHAPYAWIVSVCVAGALCAHVVAIRALVGR